MKSLFKDEWSWHTWQWITVDKVGQYVFRSPAHHWADMADPETPFWKMMEDTAGRAETDSVRKDLISCVEKQTSALAKFRPERSYIPE